MFSGCGAAGRSIISQPCCWLWICRSALEFINTSQCWLTADTFLRVDHKSGGTAAAKHEWMSLLFHFPITLLNRSLKNKTFSSRRGQKCRVSCLAAGEAGGWDSDREGQMETKTSVRHGSRNAGKTPLASCVLSSFPLFSRLLSLLLCLSHPLASPPVNLQVFWVFAHFSPCFRWHVSSETWHSRLSRVFDASF